MDNLDIKVITELRKNARVSFLSLGNQLNVSEGTIRNRVKALQDLGIIKQFTITTSEGSNCFVGITTDSKIKTQEIVKKLQALRITQIYEVAGKYDIIVYFSRETNEELNTCIENIRTLEGVKHSEMFTVLKEN
ncbi:MAG: Lrp/AsnC family transcriptional regulator [Candidatus Woesearchaeota archaeon]